MEGIDGGRPEEIQSNAREEQPKSSPGIDGGRPEEIQSKAGEEQPKSIPADETGLKNAKAKAEDAKKILTELEMCHEQAIALTGNVGVGKTWLAKQIVKSAVGEDGSFYMSLWLTLKENQHADDYNYKPVLESLARQLSIPTSANVWEDIDDFVDEEKEKDKYVDGLGVLKERVREKLQDKKQMLEKEETETKHTFLLLVLECEGVAKASDYDYIMKNVLKEVADKSPSQVKVLITTRKIEDDPAIKEVSKEVEIQPFSGVEAMTFLRKHVHDQDDVVQSSKFNGFCEAIQGRSNVLPAQIIMLADTLKRIAADGSEALQRAFDEAINILKHAREDDDIPLLPFTYQKLYEKKLHGGVMIDCFWHSCNFLSQHGGVHYNELITHWILEGYLDLALGLRKAYDEGYRIMIELIACGMLKIQEGNLIGLEGATLTLDDRSCRNLLKTSNLGLHANVLEGKNSNVFKKMVPADGMIKTVKVDKKGESVSSLLLDGSRLCREPETFFQEKKNLRVLAIFYPRLTTLPESITQMMYLRMLVLRDCYLLSNIHGIKNLNELVTLEISKAPFLKEMPDDFFASMSQLRSLNLSALGIETLPSTLSNLEKLCKLILRQCSFLKSVPKLGKLKNIEVIDLSGCSSLIRIQEKSFRSFKMLRYVDFSGTKIEKLPIVQTLDKLTILLVKGCDRLAGLRFMKSLPSLKVLDVSGATRIKEIFYDCFAQTNNLRILDLSEADIRFLPESFGQNLIDLKLRGCSKLEKLPSTKTLTCLESLDLSKATSLKKFPDDFFENLTSLKSLNLSDTKLETLPSLSHLQNLRRLFLKNCLFKSLPELKALTNLVELDLSGCKKLVNLPSLIDNKCVEIINVSSCETLSGIDESFKHMSWLEVLNLSATQISHFPDLPDSSKLRSLILSNCTLLKNSPDFKALSRLEQLDLHGTSSLTDIEVESINCLNQLQSLKLSKAACKGMQSFAALTKLEVLDFSGEAVESLPSLDSLSNLKQLLLRGCSSLTELPSLQSLTSLEVLDLSGTNVKNHVDRISELPCTQLKRLHLPKKMIGEYKWEKLKFLPLELIVDRCHISDVSEIPKGDEETSIVVHGIKLFKSLREDPNLLKSIMHRISSVHSLKTPVKYEDNYGDSREHIFNNVYNNIRKLSPEAKDGQSLEILGFDEFPTDIEVVLEYAKYVVLVENQFVKNLSDLKPDNLKSMKGCWLERCTEVASIFTESDLEIEKNLEILWISGLPILKSLYHEKVQSLSFRNLKHLYIDCCPKLETIFSSAELPKNLETLQILFCDNLKTLFGAKDPVNKEGQSTKAAVEDTSSKDKSLTNKEVQKPTQANKEVHTTTPTDKEVQTTTSTNKEVQATTPTDEEVQTTTPTDKEMQATMPATKEVQTTTPTPTDKEVQTTTPAEVQTTTPTPTDKEEVQTTTPAEVQTTTPTDKEIQATMPTNKEVQTTTPINKEVETMTPADKKVQMTSSIDRSTIKTNLKHLHISNCPMLETVFSSAQLPITLETLRIKFCGNLKSLSGQELFNSEVPYLHTLHLVELPNWTGSTMELKFNTSVLKEVKLSPNIKGDKRLVDIMGSMQTQN